MRREQEHQLDVAFLLARAMCAGSANFGNDRWTGLSSNAIVSVAFGGTQNALPSDRSDFAACVRTFRRLPPHRRTAAVIEAMKRAKEKYLENYPAHRYPAERRAEWKRLERERDEWLRRKRTRRRA